MCRKNPKSSLARRKSWAAFRLKNLEARRETTRQWRANNPEHGHDYYERNKEKILLYSKQYRKKNAGKVNSWTCRRQLALINRTPKWLTDAQLKEIEWYYVTAKELQWLSDPTDILTVDHIIPLQGKNVSGLHVPWNLQILPMTDNSKKGRKNAT